MASRQRLLPNQYQYKQQDPDYKGETLDPELQNGPIEQRSCTDILFLVIFLAFCVAMAYIAVLGFNSGKPGTLVAPFDTEGNQCGISPNYENFTYILPVANLNGLFYICVSQCPTTTNIPPFDAFCKPLISDNCSSYNFSASTPVVTACLPVDSNLNNYLNNLGLTTLTKGFADLKTTWPIILSCVGISIVFSIVLSLLIRCCAGVMVWTCILLFQLLLGGIGIISYFLPSSDSLKNILNFNNLPANLQNPQFLHVIGIVFLVLFVIFLLIICCYFKHIRVSIGIMKAASDFVRQEISVYFVPIIIVVLQILFLAFWIAVILFLFSSGSTIRVSSLEPYGWYSWNNNIRNFVVFYLFGLVWIVMFLQGLGKFLVASVAAIWYFQSGEPSHPLLRSFGRSIKAIGSIALGSFLLALIIIIQFILQLMTKYLKNSALPGQQKVILVYIAKCFSCYIACFQRFIQFITETAYIMMAITGKNFCNCASEGFYLVIRSAAQVLITQSALKVFTYIGILFITSLSTIIGWLMITHLSQFSNHIFSSLFPILAFIIVSFPLAATFMEFFSMAANTLLICYCVQKDLSSTNNKCPRALKAFLHNYVNDSQHN